MSMGLWCMGRLNLICCERSETLLLGSECCVLHPRLLWTGYLTPESRVWTRRRCFASSLILMSAQPAFVFSALQCRCVLPVLGPGLL